MKNKTMKRVAIAMAAMVAVAGFTGCGATQTQSTSAETSASAETKKQLSKERILEILNDTSKSETRTWSIDEETGWYVCTDDAFEKVVKVYASFGFSDELKAKWEEYKKGEKDLAAMIEKTTGAENVVLATKNPVNTKNYILAVTGDSILYDAFTE